MLPNLSRIKGPFAKDEDEILHWKKDCPNYPQQPEFVQPMEAFKCSGKNLCPECIEISESKDKLKL
jgi:hypothetical protein